MCFTASPRRLWAASAFTLVELLVVVLALGILVVLAAPSFLGQAEKARQAAQKQSLAVAYRAVKAWAVANDPPGSFTGATIGNAITPSEGPDFAAQLASLTGAGGDLTIVHAPAAGVQCRLVVAGQGPPAYDCEEPLLPAVIAAGFGNVGEPYLDSDETLIWSAETSNGSQVFALYTRPEGGPVETLATDTTYDYYEASLAGGLVAYVSNKDDVNLQIYKMNAGGDPALGSQLTFAAQEPNGASYPHLSPSGDQIAYVSYSGGDVVAFDHDGANRVVAAQGAAAVGGLDWSPDGATIVFIDGNGNIYSVAVDGSEATTPHLVFDAFAPGTPATGVAFSPDGSQLAYWVQDAANLESRLYVADADGGNATLYYTHPDPIADYYGLEWGEAFYYANSAGGQILTLPAP